MLESPEKNVSGQSKHEVTREQRCCQVRLLKHLHGYQVMAGGGLEAQPIHPGLWQEKLTSLVLKVFLAECFVLLANDVGTLPC